MPRYDASGNRLLILGASARAAAFSALRSGMTPVCGDLFGDADLCAVAETHVVDDYPAGLLDVANATEPADWIYTGAIENHPRLIAAVSRRHRLLGNPPDVLKRVRDPFRVSELLRSVGLPAVDVRPADRPPEDGGEWLVKPLRGGGGRGIARWTAKPQAAARGLADRSGRSVCFQRRVRGTPVSGVFLASRLSCRPAGVTRQLVGESELHAAPFAYCGSIGPLRLPESLSRQMEAIGRVLATECDLRGLFGVDCIVDRANVWAVEVNPRYTASVEVLEHACGTPLLGCHRLACRSFLEPDSATEIEAELHAAYGGGREDTQRIAGKAILFAEGDFACPSLPAGEPAGVSPRRPSVVEFPPIADVPKSGTPVLRGAPICSVFAEGTTVAACLNALFARVRSLYAEVNGAVDVQSSGGPMGAQSC